MVFDYKQWYEQNKTYLSKVKQDKYYRLKQQVYQDYGFSCEMHLCNECNIRNLMLISTYDTPEAGAFRKIKAGNTRLIYLKEIGYTKEIGVVVVCKDCYKTIRHAISSENQKAKPVKAQTTRKKSVKVEKKRTLKKWLKELFKRTPERKRSKRRKKDKKKQEAWLKARILNVEKIIAEKRIKLEDYADRLEKLEKMA